MVSLAIEAEGLGKQYFIGERSNTNNLRQAVHALLPSIRPSGTQEFWALRDVSFKIKQGEAIGVIGRNGAGKSTLLKLLSRITAPTEGRADVRGRVGTLLEVGTGFHPELTGRDNIFLSGTILGMARSEVTRKLDDIIAFSEIDGFIDTPVKRYSSGMYVRLAFAVASFLEPEILIVDEVLAVGDAAFQRKSLGRLNDASSGEGRTVLFVSHNLQAIRTFCKRVLVLEKGRLIFDGPTQDGIERYLRSVSKGVDVRDVSLKDRLNRTSGAARFADIRARNSSGEATWKVDQGDTFTLRCGFEILEAIPDLMFLAQIRSMADGQIITVIRTIISPQKMSPGQKGAFELVLPKLPLRPGEFSLYLCLGRVDDAIYYDVLDHNVDLPLLIVSSQSTSKYDRDGIVSLDYRINVLSAIALGSV